MVNDNQRSGSDSIIIFHQNICGLKRKMDELISSMSPNFPHILCFSEHHLKKFELNQINVHGYRLCVAYCRQVVKRGGVCIFVKEKKKKLRYTNIDLGKYCGDQQIICKHNKKETKETYGSRNGRRTAWV